jgi:hypothetical protein
MITLRTIEFETRMDGAAILKEVGSVTGDLNMTSFHMFDRMPEPDTSKLWFGRVNMDKETFRVIFNKDETGSKIDLSSVVIDGKIVYDFGKNTIRIRLQSTWRLIKLLLLAFFVTVFTIYIVPFNGVAVEMWPFILDLVVIAASAYTISRDLNANEQLITKYFESMKDK